MNKHEYRCDDSEEITDRLKGRIGIAVARNMRELAEYDNQNDWREKHFVNFVTLDIYEQLGEDIVTHVIEALVSPNDKSDDEIRKHVFKTIVFNSIRQEVERAVIERDEKYGKHKEDVGWIVKLDRR